MNNSEEYSQNLDSNTVVLADAGNNPFIVALVFLFSCFTDTVLFGTNINYTFIFFQRIVVIVVGLGLLFFARKKLLMGKYASRNNYAWITIVFIFATLISIGRLFSGFYYYTVVACLLIAISFGEICSLEDFSFYYIRIMTFISAYSLIIYVLHDYLGNISLIPVIRNSTGYSYKFLVFTNFPTIPAHRIRNEGPYWEAGVFQAYLNIALLLTLFFDKSKRKLLRAVLFSVSIITTLSGAAWIPLFLIIIAYMISGSKTDQKGKTRRIVLFVFLFVVIAVIYSTGFMESMITKVTEGTGSVSFAGRLASFWSDTYSFLIHPIIGTAPEILDAARNQLARSLGYDGNIGLMNTFAGWFALFGFSLGSLMVINYWRVSKFIAKRSFSSFLIFCAFVAMTSNENLTSSPLFFVIPFLLPQNILNRFLVQKGRIQHSRRTMPREDCRD